MERVVSCDAKVTGRRRERYFDTKLKMALADTGIEVSLAAEIDGMFVGFLLARVYYGEFGEMEKTAVLDTLDVDPDFRGRGVGTALMEQLQLNLRALQIDRINSQVRWGDRELMDFFQRRGFQPSPHISIELPLD
jgi:GNAT superfamily N-acetyltransferase